MLPVRERTEHLCERMATDRDGDGLAQLHECGRLCRQWPTMAAWQRFRHFFGRLALAQLALQSATMSPHAAAQSFAFAGCEQHASSVKPTIASSHGT